MENHKSRSRGAKVAFGSLQMETHDSSTNVRVYPTDLSHTIISYLNMGTK